MGNTSVKTQKRIEDVERLHVIFEHEDNYQLEPTQLKEKHNPTRRCQSSKSESIKETKIRFSSFTKQRDVEVNVNDFEQTDCHGYQKERIERIFKTNQFDVVFNSRIDGIDQRDLISSIKYKKDLILLCKTTNDEIIGCGFNNPLSTLNIFADKLFILSPNKTQMIHPKPYTIQPNTIPLKTIQNNSLLFSVHAAFWISDSLQLNFNPSISLMYDCFPKCIIPKKSISLDSFIVITPLCS